MKKTVSHLVKIRLSNKSVANPPRLVRANSAFQKPAGA